MNEFFYALQIAFANEKFTGRNVNKCYSVMIFRSKMDASEEIIVFSIKNSITSKDLNLDGLPDIIVANVRQENAVFLNEKNGRFVI